MRVKLYAGLKREGKWFRYAEIEKTKGSNLAALDTVDKSGAARLLHLFKKNGFNLFSEAGEEYEMKDPDYKDITMVDSWPIARAIMKMMNNTEKLVFPEMFFCSTCSTMGMERYTEVNEDWEELVEKGLIDEFFLTEDEEATYTVELPIGAEIAPTRNLPGGIFNKIKRRPLTIQDMINVNKNPKAMATELNLVCALWDASIIEVEGMSQREFNTYVKRNTAESFSKNYIIEAEDVEAMEQSDIDNKLGYDAMYRPVSCQYCGSEIGGYLDFTNFFQSMLSRRSSQNRTRKTVNA